MDNRYEAVLSTYFRRPTGFRDGLLPALGLLFYAAEFLSRVAEPAWSGPNFLTTVSVGMSVGLIGVGLWSKLREQALSDRRHLWPDYVVPHVTVFVALAIVTVFFGPLILARGDSSALGLTACVAALFTILGWFVASPSLLNLAVLTGAFGFFMFGVNEQPLWGILCGDRQVMAAGLLCIGMFGSAAVVMRMLTMTEEHPRYAQGLGAANGKSAAFDPKQYPSWWPMPRLRLDALASGGGIIARSRRWRAVVKLNWFYFLFLPGINVAMELSIPHGNTGLAIRNSWMAMPAIFLLLPANAVGASWIRAWPYLELDFARVPGRRDFIREIGAAIAVQTMQGWAITAAVFSLATVLWHTPATLLVCVLLGSLAAQALIFAVVVWAMRYRSAGLVGLLGLPMCLALSVVAFFQDAKWLEWLFYTGFAAFGCAIVGLWLTRRAYRLWLKTELG